MGRTLGRKSELLVGAWAGSRSCLKKFGKEVGIVSRILGRRSELLEESKEESRNCG